MRIEPASFVRGTFTLPGDKSISHRAALIGAMAEGETRVRNFSSAADCASTLACLRGLGVAIRQDGAELVIEGGLDGLARARRRARRGQLGLDDPDAGRCARRAGRSARRSRATPRCGRRPLERVAAPLRAMGASVETTGGSAPLTITGGPLRGFAHDLPVASAQVKTAVLLAGLQAEGRTTVREPMPSRDHTERMLAAFGVPVERDGLSASVIGGTPLRGTTVNVPGDASSAAFLVVAALVRPDSEVRLEGVLLSPTRTAFVEVLRAMGGRVETELDDDRAGARRDDRGLVLGAARGPRRPRARALADRRGAGAGGGGGLRERRARDHRRLRAAAQGERPHRGARERARRRSGCRCASCRTASWSRAARGSAGHGVDSHDDHRIAMALAVAALGASGPTEIARGECVSRLVPGVLRARRPGHGPCLSGRRASCSSGSWARARPRIGRRLARRLGYRFEDMDRRIERARGPHGREPVRGARRGRLPGAGARGGPRRVRALGCRRRDRGRGVRPGGDARAAPGRARSRSGCSAAWRPPCCGCGPTAAARWPGTVR